MYINSQAPLKIGPILKKSAQIYYIKFGCLGFTFMTWRAPNGFLGADMYFNWKVCFEY